MPWRGVSQLMRQALLFLRDASGRHSTSPFLVVGRDGEGYFARHGRGGVLPKMEAMRGLGHLRLIPRNLKTDDDTARLNCLPPPPSFSQPACLGSPFPSETRTRPLIVSSTTSDALLVPSSDQATHTGMLTDDRTSGPDGSRLAVSCP